MIEHPKTKGDRTALAVMIALQDAGFGVALPFGENTRYDLVIDDGRSLARVQCKTGRLREGAVRWNACSNYAHHANPGMAQRDYIGDIDYFAVYCPETSGVYLVPIQHAQVRTRGSLRGHPPRNNQRRLIRLAHEYEIGRVNIQPLNARVAG